MNKKLNKCLLISFLLGAAYMAYSAVYWSGALEQGGGTAEKIGAGLATALVAPHLICSALGVVFNGLGVFLRKRGFALAGAIIYSVAILVFPLYFMFVVVEAVLSYIGFALMGKHSDAYDGSLDISDGYTPKNICSVCGKKKNMLEEFYYGMCRDCAIDTRDGIKEDLKSIKDFIETCKNDDAYRTEENVNNYLNKIDILEETKKTFPGFKKSLREEREIISSLINKNE